MLFAKITEDVNCGCPACLAFFWFNSEVLNGYNVRYLINI